MTVEQPPVKAGSPRLCLEKHPRVPGKDWGQHHRQDLCGQKPRNMHDADPGTMASKAGFTLVNPR